MCERWEQGRRAGDASVASLHAVFAGNTHVWGSGSRTLGKGALGVDVGPKQGARESDGVRSRQSCAGKESVARVSEGGEGKGKTGGVGVGRASLVVRGMSRPHAAVGTLEGQAFEV